jgi:hypothetical protein
VYIEETGAGDGDIKVTVDGAEYTAEANQDLDGDGVDDAVTVMTDDGHVAYVDENTDGAADIMQTVDAHGTVVEQARFDTATGRWVAEAPHQQPQHDEPHDPGSMVVDTPHGDQRIGPATEDTNNDGKADTAIVETDTGTMLVTDVDGDGSADQMVEVDGTGEVTISHHTGDGQWTVVEEGRIDQNGQYTPNPLSSALGTDDATWTFDEPGPGGQPAHAHQEPATPPVPPGAPNPAPPPDDDSVWA